ncbi:MAG: amino acid--tRNA ligase-related protein, partial [Candidatus Methanomethylicaceae archaeon]
EIGLSADLMAPNYGEISTGGVREDDINSLIQRIKESGFDPSAYEWYLDLRRYGSVPHAGCGFGIERFVQWILGLEHIRDSLPVPRMARISEVRL